MISTEKEMRSFILKQTALYARREGEVIPEGLSVTETGISRWYRYREGSIIATLHERFSDGHTCFEVVDNA